MVTYFYSRAVLIEVEGILVTFVTCNIAMSNKNYSMVFALSSTERVASKCHLRINPITLLLLIPTV